MKKLLSLTILFSCTLAFTQSKIASHESQINTAIKAAPEMLQEGAKVLGYNQNGKLITLREGKNDIICLADDPKKEGISVSCYSDKLEDYMARGRELRAQGKTESEKREIRGKEIDEGKLKMPKEPAAVYVLTATQEDYDLGSGELINSRIRYVLYKPYMSAKETGLPIKPGAPGMPWLMDPDTHRSHIMISPAPAK